ncbi:MAG: glyoxylate/hydroxypyruvate reductase A [Roseovarius sp.]|nr:glyoxylate/hydroxypyruvate reductase A [Roseovarius sp.]MCY4317562.1 glyoxylate/hydroxypyruvate reductase A [Roseovarius sp.]
MPINVLFSACAERWDQFERPLKSAFGEMGLDVNLSTSINPADVDYVVYAPNGGLENFSPYTRTKAVLSLWAGVENIVGNKTLTQPLARMVDHGLTQGMVEWVSGHVLRHHLGMDIHIHGQDGCWRGYFPPLAGNRRVAILGLGELGLACGRALAGFGFPVCGWSRTKKNLRGITCHHGADGLKSILSKADILVLLLPLTPETESLLNASTISMMPEGSFIINPGRGQHIDDKALLEALDSGLIAHATLDVFRTEPLPVDHPYWQHPNVTVTPHIASETRAATASQVIAENIRRGEAGEPFLHLVDRKLGY